MKAASLLQYVLIIMTNVHTGQLSECLVSAVCNNTASQWIDESACERPLCVFIYLFIYFQNHYPARMKRSNIYESFSLHGVSPAGEYDTSPKGWHVLTVPVRLYIDSSRFLKWFL